MAVTMRNYKRHMGVLLSTRWKIEELELGVMEKEYDQNTGDYMWERKVIKLNPQGVIDQQWIMERLTEAEMAKVNEANSENNEQVDNTAPTES